ncbi:MAG: hypothetical protein H6618_04445 [Deltaproteobacteria bacterium]|nr:hypothetical protein [Deltaproteobacteria bacterium]
MTITIKDYLHEEDKESRIMLLKRMQECGSGLPTDLSGDLLCLNLDPDEKSAILSSVYDPDPLMTEDYLTSFIGAPQDQAVTALRKWAESTQHLLWHRCLSQLRATHTPQRVRYTILDLCPFMEGTELLDVVTRTDAIQELSPAFHGLFLLRSIQWNHFSETARQLAEKILESMKEPSWQTHLAQILAIFWYKRFLPEQSEQKLFPPDISGNWRDLNRAVLCYQQPVQNIAAHILKLTKSGSEESFWDEIEAIWPPVFIRQQLSSEVTQSMIRACFRKKQQKSCATHSLWQYFGGIMPEQIRKAIATLNDPKEFAFSVNMLKGFGGICQHQEILNSAEAHLKSAENSEAFLETLPLRLQLQLIRCQKIKETTAQHNIMQVLEEEERHRQTSFSPDTKWTDFSIFSFKKQKQNTQRRHFFDVAYRGKNPDMSHPLENADHFWSLLLRNWLNPEINDLNDLARMARQEPRIFQLSYIHTLGRFHGRDEAVLKLLDYIRSSRTYEVRAVIHALESIGSTRACHELVASITRPNMITSLQTDICHLLRTMDLSSFQSEIRSIFSTMNDKKPKTEGEQEVCDILASLIDSKQTESVSDISSFPSDDDLEQKIPEFRQLSHEVQRSLRTAQFFSRQTNETHRSQAIDLSPVIDMQYKALELMFRETFEELCSELLRQGVLQRKLDVIGYSRPIPSAMDRFENYISSLPVIRDIPYFSKFKLRKMLRAVCQFRPGRRFTLDGLKAFALFFLCFGRKTCDSGLASLLPLSFPSDQDLFVFCKDLHMFQDIRNRAVHEGIFPDIRNDAEKIWTQTSSVITTVLNLKRSL